jgi:diguanylate cyclase (GGDEF)-like protein
MLKVLIVDDDPDILDLLEATLCGDYTLVRASCGTEALAKAREESPDLIVMDYNMPDMQGPDVTRALRKDQRFLNTSILMLTGKGEVEDKVKGLEAGVDDYMLKPFAPRELLARLSMLIRRSTVALDANPLTRLPGNVSINKELETRIGTDQKFAVLYSDIDHFKAVNDYYGFSRGDTVIKEAARIIIDAGQKKGTVNDFIGHIGGDDFVTITGIETAESIAKEIVTGFDKAAPLFFDEKDRIKGYIETKGRDGEVAKFGFLTISIGIITSSNRRFNHVAEIGAVGAEVKALAKKFNQSKYIFDRRVL